jgi:nucleoside 2-deoxyribosyltransferase
LNKFYIASSFRNVDAVHYVSERLKSKGYIQTYDWTQNAEAHDALTFTFEDLKNIGQKEQQGVLDSDVVIVLLPGGKGTHIEFGIAIGHGKRIFLYSPDQAIKDPQTTSTFYHLPEVETCFGTLDELLEKVMG